MAYTKAFSFVLNIRGLSCPGLFLKGDIMKKLSTLSRVIIAIGALALIIVYFVPVWSIYLIAPQYPEGLSMQIWLDKLSGQVEIINGLNHYIGMRHIKEEMFPEFGYLVYILGFYILFGLAVALTGSRKLLMGYLFLFVVGGVAALVDFYLWGYDYGHNLDPTAAIQVPGMSYQPPVIGHKKLLNFDAFSYPDTGGWIAIAVAGVFFLIWFLDWRKNRKMKKRTTRTKTVSTAVTILACLVMTGCNPKAEKIAVGKDACSECKMTIMDPKFGGEIVTKKGKVFKFDDAHCMAKFFERRGVEYNDIHQTLFVNYEGDNGFLKSKEAEFVVSSSFKSPMGSNAAAFAGVPAAEKKSKEIPGSKVTNWATLYNILIK
jgi:copper chaperone NosL